LFQGQKLRVAARVQEVVLDAVHDAHRRLRLGPIEPERHLRPLHLDRQPLFQGAHHVALARGGIGAPHPQPIPELQDRSAAPLPPLDQVLVPDQLDEVLMREDDFRRAGQEPAGLTAALVERSRSAFHGKREEPRLDVIAARQRPRGRHHRRGEKNQQRDGEHPPASDGTQRESEVVAQLARLEEHRPQRCGGKAIR